DPVTAGTERRCCPAESGAQRLAGRGVAHLGVRLAVGRGARAAEGSCRAGARRPPWAPACGYERLPAAARVALGSVQFVEVDPDHRLPDAAGHPSAGELVV